MSKHYKHPDDVKMIDKLADAARSHISASVAGPIEGTVTAMGYEEPPFVAYSHAQYDGVKAALEEFPVVANNALEPVNRVKAILQVGDD